MVDLTVERIQNRQGLKINLPQPLRPGELGFCTDTKEMFIGGNPLYVDPGVQIEAGDYATAQSLLDNNILIAYTDNSYLDAATAIAAAEAQITLSQYPAHSGAAIKSVHYVINGVQDYFLIGISDIAASEPNFDLVKIEIKSVIDSLNEINGLVGSKESWYGSSTTLYAGQPIPPWGTTSTWKPLDLHGGAVCESHDEANAIASILNTLVTPLNTSAQAIALTELNIEVITEYSQYEHPSDHLVKDPIITTLQYEQIALGTGNDFYVAAPAYPAFVEVPPVYEGSPLSVAGIYSVLKYDVAESDTINIDYSISYNNGTLHYNQNGTLTVTTNLFAEAAELVDDNNLMTNMAPGTLLDFQAYYDTVEEVTKIEYRQNFDINGAYDPAENVIMKITTKRWLSF